MSSNHGVFISINEITVAVNIRQMMQQFQDNKISSLNTTESFPSSTSSLTLAESFSTCTKLV